MVVIPRARHARAARMTFSELPLELMATRTSPGRPSASICRWKTFSKQKSLACDVRNDVSVVESLAREGLDVAGLAAGGS